MRFRSPDLPRWAAGSAVTMSRPQHNLAAAAPSSFIGAFVLFLVAVLWASGVRGWWIMQFLVYTVPIVIGAAAATSCISSVRGERGFGPIATAVFCVTTIFAVALPGQLLLTNQRQSVLAFFGIRSPNVVSDVPKAYLITLLCLCAFAITDGQTYVPKIRRLRGSVKRILPSERVPTYLALMVIGATSLLLLGSAQTQQALTLRGETRGTGWQVFFTNLLPLGITLGIVRRHWNDRRLALLSLLGAIMVGTSVSSRSVLLLPAVAILIRVLRAIRTRPISVRSVVILVATAYASALLIVAFGQWRTQVTESGHGSFVHQVLIAAPDPLVGLAAKGSVDTLDGAVLAVNVNRDAVHASYFDPLKAITNLVPYQLWHSKPGFLSNEVTRYYTSFGGLSGIFLSGPGYSYVVFNGALGMSLAFGALGLVAGRLSQSWFDRPLWYCLFLYFCVRFFLGGDALDGLFILTMALGLVFARSVGTLVTAISRR